MKYTYHFFITLALIFLSLSACKEKGTDIEPAESDFDRSALLIDLADLIDDSYEDFQLRVEELDLRIQEFTLAPSQPRLTATRVAWTQALKHWQHVAPFQFGKAAELAMEASTNVYPASANLIESNISNGEYNLDAASNLSAIGLQAMDYLLHGGGADDAEILARFSSDSFASERLSYLNALSQQMLSRTTQVASTWSSSSTEYADFVANDGTDQGSSIGLFLNAFNQSFESSTRTHKLGIPAGALTFSMTPNPTSVEAYYENSQSLTYLKESIDAFEKIYLGADEDDVSLSDYLVALDAQHGGQSLDEAIRMQLINVRTSIDLMQAPLSEFVENEQELALDAFAELQALVVLWKVDMMSSLSILITYQDTDGD